MPTHVSLLERSLIGSLEKTVWSSQFPNEKTIHGTEEEKWKLFPWLKNLCWTHHPILFLSRKVPAKCARFSTLPLQERFANEQCVDQSSEGQRCSNIYSEHFAERYPRVLQGGHRLTLGRDVVSSVLRDHSFPPGASSHPLPPSLTPLRKMFYELCVWIFLCSQQRMLFS